MSDLSVILPVAVVIGLSVGMLTGIFGVGGGFLMTPALIVLLGIKGNVAVGTGLACFLCTSSLGLYHRRHSDTIDFKLAITISLGSIIGVFSGSHLMQCLKDLSSVQFLGQSLNAVEFVLLCLFLLLLAAIAAYLSLDYKRTKGLSPDMRVGLLAHFKIPPFMYFNSLENPEMSLPMLLAVGYCVGVLTGLLGIGGGVVLLPILIYVVGQRTAKAAGTSLVLVWISSAAGVILKAGHGDIVPSLFVALLAGGLLGTWIGTKVGLALAGARIRLYFVYVVLLAAAMVAVKLAKLLWF